MNVGYDRDVAAARSQTFHDMLEIARIFNRRRGNPHDLTADLSQFQCLRD